MTKRLKFKVLSIDIEGESGSMADLVSTAFDQVKAAASDNCATYTNTTRTERGTVHVFAEFAREPAKERRHPLRGRRRP